MMLEDEAVEVSGPAQDVYRAIFTGILQTLILSGMDERSADALAMRALVRVEAHLGSHGYVVRPLRLDT